MTEREFLNEQLNRAQSSLKYEIAEVKAAGKNVVDVRKWYRQFPKATIGVGAGAAVLGGLWITSLVLRRKEMPTAAQARSSTGARVVRTSNILLRALRPLQKIAIGAAMTQLTRFLGLEANKTQAEAQSVQANGTAA